MHRLVAALFGALAVCLMSSAVAVAHDPRADRPNRATSPSGVNVPVVTSPGVRLVDTFPETLGHLGRVREDGQFLVRLQP